MDTLERLDPDDLRTLEDDPSFEQLLRSIDRSDRLARLSLAVSLLTLAVAVAALLVALFGLHVSV